MRSLEELSLYLREFARVRDWTQFHNPKIFAWPSVLRWPRPVSIFSG